MRLRWRRLAGLEWYAGLGAPLLAGAAAAAWLLFRRGNRTGAVVAVLAASLLFTAGVGGLGADAVEAWKAPRALAGALPEDQTRREVRVAAYAYFQPSLIFYCQREVRRLDTEQQALDFLRGPLPSYLFLPMEQWRSLQAKAPEAHELLGPRRDLLDNREVVADE